MYNYADIFLFPTRLEGFGLSVAEAMACGKPIVTTDCSSMPELVIDGKGGFLCEMDNVKDFADSIRILAEDSGLRRQMGTFNRARVIEKFSLDRMVQEYITVYKKL
jgi:Glycosyltransferase